MISTNTNLIPKELSWLDYSECVLSEASDQSRSIAERIRFLSIFSSNMDEFFRVRVATLRKLSQKTKGRSRAQQEEIDQTMHEVYRRSADQQSVFNQIFDAIIEDAMQRFVSFITIKQFTNDDKEWCENYFAETISQSFFPVLIGPRSNLKSISDGYPYLAVVAKDSRNRERLIVVEIPYSGDDRFVRRKSDGKSKYYCIDDIVRTGIKIILEPLGFFPADSFSFTIIRDAELDIDEDLSESLYNKVNRGLRKRKKGSTVLFSYEKGIPAKILRRLQSVLGVDSVQSIPSGPYQSCKDIIFFEKFIGSDSEIISKESLSPTHVNSPLFAQIDRQDYLFTFPYHTYHSFTALLREAAFDDKVESISISLYRVAPRSDIVASLLAACRNGKDVTAVVELRARFDEEANITLAEHLSDEGIRVLFGLHGLKVHAKLCLITRRDKTRKRYACIGTGNFNETTAERYIDNIIVTADKRITSEVSDVFSFFREKYQRLSFEHLLVSPFQLRKKLAKLIMKEGEKSAKGGCGSIRIRVNNLTDKEIIEKIITASGMGASVRLLVRGMCSIGDSPSFPETFQAKRIVGDFLEHSRVFIFGDGKDKKVYISSADCMARNFDRRFEVAVPVYAAHLADELVDLFELSWKDNQKGRMIIGENAEDDHIPHLSQKEIGQYLSEKYSVIRGVSKTIV